MRAWGRGSLPTNKMAEPSLFSDFSWGTQICVVPGTVLLHGQGEEARGELQLWHHEISKHYRIYASRRAVDGRVVCELFMLFLIFPQGVTNR